MYVMSFNKIFRNLILGVFFFSVTSSNSNSHPWGGLVIDSEGNIYFTFICPFVDDDHHYACVWLIDSSNSSKEILKASSSPSDIVLERTKDRQIFAAERSGNSPNYLNKLWRITPQNSIQVIKPTTNQYLFHIQTYAVNDSGILFFAKSNKLFQRDSLGVVSEINLDLNLNRIQLLEFGPSGKLFVLADNNLYRWEGESLSLIAEELKEDDPENIPFRGANIIFDMVVDEDENSYLAYYGNRKVLKISSQGEVSEVISSTAPWSPHGIDFYEGEVYILESTLGDGQWWKFWDNDDEIVPRVRKISKDGKVTEIFSYKQN